MKIETVRAEDVRCGDFVIYAGRGRAVLSVQLGPIIGLQLVDRSMMLLGRGAPVEVVEESER
jgi:hypothetical protein